MDSRQKKILILYAAIGLGHKSIAENIAFHLTRAGYEVKLMDAQKTQGGTLAKAGKVFYQWMIQAWPGLWDFFYNTKWFINLTLPGRIKVAAKNHSEILNVLQAFSPDMVICTHTTASAIISYIKQQGLYRGVFAIAFSDFHLHPYWLYQNADAYLANTKEQKIEIIELGVRPEQIFVCGMSMPPKAEVDTAKAKEKYGIAEGEKVVLFSSGSQGFGIDENLVSAILSRPQTKAIVLCGSNKKAFEYLAEKFKGANAVILSYHEFMAELYAIADIFVTKAGALSASEALQWRLPILVSHLLPGQEIHNFNYLLKRSLVMPKPTNLLDSILTELDRGDFKKAVLNNAEIAGLLGSGGEVVGAVNEALNKNI